MAQYSIHRACGHAETVRIYGPDQHDERKRALAHEATRQCYECYSAARDASRAVEAETAAAAAQDRGLPALTGSPKQVGWAEKIRAEVLAAHAVAMRYQQSIPNAGPASAALQSWWIETTTAILTRPAEAKWWIDHRDTPWIKLVHSLMTPDARASYDVLQDAANYEVLQAAVTGKPVHPNPFGGMH